ncbi:MAG TPA: hypothetical protein VHA52_01655 [Candidatus Babeliaceae bacterium]|nr:hypothetical protein [Candidatus Babeliaceae bacterium]
MSRYLLLFILNVPFVVMAIVSEITHYKLGHVNKKRTLGHLFFWIIVLVGLATAKFIYEWLFNNSLTQSEPLSLFDVIQTTGIVIVFYVANRTRSKLEELEIKFRDLHQELSIRLSEDEKNIK